MENDNRMRFIKFEDYCAECKHKALNSAKDPCNECLKYGAWEGTWAPLNFEKED